MLDFKHVNIKKEDGMKKKKKLDRSVFQSLALISQFGINMLVPIGLMLWLGIWLDRKFGTSWIVVLCFFAGAIAGFQNIYKMAKNLMHSEKENDHLRRNDDKQTERD